MDYQVILSPRAIQDLAEIVRYVSLDKPNAAEKLGNALINVALALRIFPERGRFVPEFDDQITRELIYGSYRIVYRINTDKSTIEVSRFWHAARGTPQM